jgi:hypothetical protein
MRIPVEKICPICSKKFVTQPCRIKDTITCSPKCKGEKVKLQMKDATFSPTSRMIRFQGRQNQVAPQK